MPTLDSIASCLADYDPNALRVNVAKEFIARLLTKLSTVERLPIRSALNRVLAADVVSPIDVPAHDNSAMDGYAFSSSDLRPDGETVLRVAGKAFAGDVPTGAIGPSVCVRIMTGAMMPPGLDTVVPQELVTPVSRERALEGSGVRYDDQELPGHISIPRAAVKAGHNRRLKGEDLALGKRALAAGRLLRPADIGLLASLGQAEVSVLRRLRVAFFSTGNELRSLGEPLEAGCVYDSNRYTLWAMLQRMGFEVIDLGVVRDDPGALAMALTQAATDADAIITSGGVGVGEADYTRHVMAQVGDVAFWSVAMRPGRPLAVGSIKGANGRTALLFGLPGNPVAVMTSFYAIVRPSLLSMSGVEEPTQLLVQAMSAGVIRKKPGRTEYLRALVSCNPSGQLQVDVTGPQGSGVLRSMSEANALAVLGHDRGTVAQGEPVDVLLFDGLV